MLNKLKENIILNLKNIPGKSTPAKIVVIECDDWGGIRTPSREVYDKLAGRNLVDINCRYRNDTLSTSEDMEQLFHVLESARGKNNCAVMTPVVNVANPDFTKIRDSGFSEYHYEKFTDTLKRYGRGPEVFALWKKGIQKGIFIPELHGREHVTVQLWMNKLREGNEKLRFAFENEFISIDLPEIKTAANGFRAEFYFDSPDQTPFLERSVSEGVDLFSSIFGYNPEVFVPSNAIFHPVFEKTLANSGVKYLNVGHINLIPDEKGGLKKKYYRNGKQTKSGLRYYIRNCAFEPTDPKYRGIESTLKQVKASFRWGKPAIISTHRVNFSGGIDPYNREYGLSELKLLLLSIVKNWPDAEFMSSSAMFNFLWSKQK